MTFRRVRQIMGRQDNAIYRPIPVRPESRHDRAWRGGGNLFGDAIMSCDVCQGLGTYPIHNQSGTQLYDIQCPDCFGTGETEEENLARFDRERDETRYESAMREMRAKATCAKP
jgi:hypothetical protein